MGDTRRTRHPQGRTDLLHGPTRCACNAAPQIPWATQAGDLGEKLGGGTAVSRRVDLQEEIQDAREPEVGQWGSWEH